MKDQTFHARKTCSLWEERTLWCIQLVQGGHPCLSYPRFHFFSLWFVFATPSPLSSFFLLLSLSSHALFLPECNIDIFIPTLQFLTLQSLITLPPCLLMQLNYSVLASQALHSNSTWFKKTTWLVFCHFSFGFWVFSGFRLFFQYIEAMRCPKVNIVVHPPSPTFKGLCRLL